MILEKNNWGYINEADEDGEIIARYDNPQHLYDVMKSRYIALKNKREKDIAKSFIKGWYFGIAITLSIAIILKYFF